MNPAYKQQEAEAMKVKYLNPEYKQLKIEAMKS